MSFVSASTPPDFCAVWDAYEKQTEVLILQDMPALRGMPPSAYAAMVGQHKHVRRMGAFDIRHYVGRSHRVMPIGVRPHPTPSTVDDFRTLARAWDAVPSVDFEVWEPDCTEEEYAPMYLNDLASKEAYFNEGHSYLVAFKEGSPVGMAQIGIISGDVHLDYLVSKSPGAGSTLLKAIDMFAIANAAAMTFFMSMNWVRASSAQSCKLLPPGEYTSLNEFYKRHGYRDTENACAPEWASVRLPEGVFDGPLLRKPEYMSKCYPEQAAVHADVFHPPGVPALLAHLARTPRAAGIARLAVLRGISKYAHARFNDMFGGAIVAMCCNALRAVKDPAVKARLWSEFEDAGAGDHEFLEYILRVA